MHYLAGLSRSLNLCCSGLQGPPYPTPGAASCCEPASAPELKESVCPALVECVSSTLHPALMCLGVWYMVYGMEQQRNHPVKGVYVNPPSRQEGEVDCARCLCAVAPSTLDTFTWYGLRV